MKPRNRNTTYYRSGIIRRTKEGTWRAEVNAAYKRHRKTHPTLEKAKAWIEAVTAQLEAEQRPLSPVEYNDALHARNLLPEHMTLTEAVQIARKTAPNLDPIPTREAVVRFIEHKAALGLRQRSMASLRTYVNRLARDYPDTPIHELTTPKLLEWFRTLGARGATWNNHRRNLHGLFTWAVAQHHATTNPIPAIPTARKDQTLAGILTIPQVQAILTAAHNHVPRIAPYIALGLFAGIRPEEGMRITWQAIHPDHIHIGPNVAKVRQQRYVEILPVLRAWLDACTPPQTGPIAPQPFRAPFNAVREHAGLIDAWPNDALRHSFATYHLAHFQDAGRTAHQLGHQNPSLLYRHYRNLATPEHAAAFFNLTPDNLET